MSEDKRLPGIGVSPDDVAALLNWVVSAYSLGRRHPPAKVGEDCYAHFAHELERAARFTRDAEQAFITGIQKILSERQPMAPLPGRCKDCMFWHEVNTGRHQWHECEASTWTPMTSPMEEDGFALYAEATDDSGVESGIKTGPEFGCTKFKKL